MYSYSEGNVWSYACHSYAGSSEVDAISPTSTCCFSLDASFTTRHETDLKY
jgi:hypothetical protein